MSTRTQDYLVIPPSACPAHLLGPTNVPLTRLSFDIDVVAASAWAEILQSAPGAHSLAGLMEALLEPSSSDLLWQASGPGRGTEMRRAFSGMFGRFFARAYLDINHGYCWFNPIDGDPYSLSTNWRVRRKRNKKTNMPDWICAKPGQLAIGEAKGSNIDGAFPPKRKPAPIKKAEEQIKGVVVEKRVASSRRASWQKKRVKGWAVMSRWGTASPLRHPYLYALDPNTDGEPLTSEERGTLEQLVARRHVELLAIGLGIVDPKALQDPKIDSPSVSGRRFVASSMDLPGEFVGTVFSPFGPVDMDLQQARALSKQLPDPRMLQFVGIEEKVLKAYLTNSPLTPVTRERRRDTVVLGSDGLIIAPISQLSDGDTIG